VCLVDLTAGSRAEAVKPAPWLLNDTQKVGVWLPSADHYTLARRLAAIGVVAFHCGTTARTLLSAFQRREQVGEDFDRMP
jgi:hypothetical protein